MSKSGHKVADLASSASPFVNFHCQPKTEKKERTKYANVKNGTEVKKGKYIGPAEVHLQPKGGSSDGGAQIL